MSVVMLSWNVNIMILKNDIAVIFKNVKSRETMEKS